MSGNLHAFFCLLLLVPFLRRRIRRPPGCGAGSGPGGANDAPRQARLTIGVALEGGGALGLAHVGVLQWFEDHHIPIDYLAGTSMGGLVGGLYATGKSPATASAS
jgi:NTE family protein